MLFMVIERFRDDDMMPIYQRLETSGRQLPDGLEYVDSWIEVNFARCFQLMRCNSRIRFPPDASMRVRHASVVIMQVAGTHLHSRVRSWFSCATGEPAGGRRRWSGH